jgi:hypothetical protein
MTQKCRIPFEALLDFHEGLSAGPPAKTITRHIADGCPTCRTELAWIEEFLPAVSGAMRTEELQVSRSALVRAHNVMRERNEVRPERITKPVVQRLVAAAALLFDSRKQQPALSTARDSADSSVHSVYRTESADVDLWQEGNSRGSWFVTGQALPVANEEMPPPRMACLTSARYGPQEALVEDNEFSFDCVASGRYSLRLLWDDMEIQVDDLDVGLVEAL